MNQWFNIFTYQELLRGPKLVKIYYMKSFKKSKFKNINSEKKHNKKYFKKKKVTKIKGNCKV